MLRFQRTWVLALTLGLQLANQTSASILLDDEGPTDPPPNYEDHIAEIMSDYCVSCHRGSRARNGLQLQSLGAMLEGGSSGPALIPGDPGGSLMLQLMRHEREPFMPEDEDKLEDAVLDLVSAWIEAGAPASATSGPSGGAGNVLVVAPEPVRERVVLHGTEPVAALPVGVRTAPLWWASRGNAVIALAASPTVNLVAIGGHRQISLYDPSTGSVLGMLAFPEGQVHELRFSQSGALLLAGGGRGGESGSVVIFDVVSGERRFLLGAEPDSVLSADISSDLGLVALGGVDGILRVFSTESGEQLYISEKHTDWITAVAFSPDGVLLASADRAGGLVVWEALTGREFHPLGPRKSGVEALAWRSDSLLLASGAQDGELALYEMQAGKQLRSWKSHGGVLGLDYLANGQLLSSGRDARARIWDDAGKEQAHFDGAQRLAGSCAASFDGKLLMVGDMAGLVRVYEAGKPQAVRSLRANPATELELAAGRASAAAQRTLAVYDELMLRYKASSDQVLASSASFDKAKQAEESLGAQHQAALLAQATALENSNRASAAAAPAAVSSRLAGERLAGLTKDLERARMASQQRSAASLEVARQQVILERALQAAADSMRAQIEAELELVSSQLEGALALARLAAAEQASLETQEASASLQRELWVEIETPLNATAQTCAQSLKESQGQVQLLAKDWKQAKASFAAAQSALAGHQAALVAQDAPRLAALAERDHAAQERQVAQAAWGEQRQQIEIESGRVLLPTD
ncbi:MAG: hypothetical protein ACI8QC_003328 [Planctomycetota bacterium]|jgi:hypothetical protein